MTRIDESFPGVVSAQSGPDKGPWLGRAVVWKLQVGLHQDALDEGPAVCFLCGNYEGGQLCLPDLDAKLE